jgi:hypothetical protein
VLRFQPLCRCFACSFLNHPGRFSPISAPVVGGPTVVVGNVPGHQMLDPMVFWVIFLVGLVYSNAVLLDLLFYLLWCCVVLFGFIRTLLWFVFCCSGYFSIF